MGTHRNRLDSKLGGHRVLLAAMNRANRVHRAQRTKLDNDPFIVHPLHCLSILQSCGFRPEDPEELEVMVAAIFHDGVEDRPRLISFDDIEREFGPRCRELVEAVTLPPGDDSAETKRQERQKLLRLGWQEQSVKMADVASNSLRLATAIESRGLANVQPQFGQPMEHRVDMEWAFVSGCLRRKGAVPNCARNLKLIARGCVSELDAAIDAA